MAIAKIKTAEERERLDRIFAEVEAAERGDTMEPVDTRTLEQRDEDNRRNTKGYADPGNNYFVIKWEE